MNAQHDDYAQAGLAGTLEWGASPAVVVVDAVVAYTDPECHLFAGPSAVAAAGVMGEVITAAREHGIPVVSTFMELNADGSNAGLFYRKVNAIRAFMPGGRYAGFVPEAEPAAGETVLAKQYPSAFFGTDLVTHLRDAGVDTVFLLGYSTSGCIRATALDALQNGFIPVVVTDGVADRDEAIHQANLFDIGHKMAELATSAEVTARAFGRH